MNDEHPRSNFAADIKAPKMRLAGGDFNLRIETPAVSLLRKLTDPQKDAVCSQQRRVLVVAGAGSGKTEVMARRIAWWLAVEAVPKERVVALTFTEKAAREMKFRVRRWIGEVSESDNDVSLGDMYVGTIHGFCLRKLREFWPDRYHNFDILDEAARDALVRRGFYTLGLVALKKALRTSQIETIRQFFTAYDQLHEHNRFSVRLSSEVAPQELGRAEQEWCREAQLLTSVGTGPAPEAFGIAAARYYAYLQCRRFLDFSTSQTEFVARLKEDRRRLEAFRAERLHVVVDEVQDINPVQRDLIQTLVGDSGKLTAVGDHRQAIYGFRGAKVEIIGDLWNDLREADDAQVVDLRHNFRSTPRLIRIANDWAHTISPARGMDTTDMLHGKEERLDAGTSHIGLVRFPERSQEAAWIAESILRLVPSGAEGAEHDRRDGSKRGISLSDLAVLVRSSTDVRTYMQALEEAGIPAVVRAGPDLFSQPEVLLFVGALAVSADMDEFFGSSWSPGSLPKRIKEVLGAPPHPEAVVRAAAQRLRAAGLELAPDAEERVIAAARALKSRIHDEPTELKEVESIQTRGLRMFLRSDRQLRRVFPQQIFHWLMAEAGVDQWDSGSTRGEAAMFHLGAFSGIVTGMETPGWTSPRDYRWQVIGLCYYGSESGRTPEQPLIVPPNAVTISTVHAVKGLQFAGVFLADVCARRFPSSRAKHEAKVPLSGQIVEDIDIAGLSDNDNYDAERRLMYVALTRAERFLFISASGKQMSQFIKSLSTIVEDCGGTVSDDTANFLTDVQYRPRAYERKFELATSFSDFRYYMQCPHDFYLRKVLGFAPTIDQAFGYGRGVHNLMRAVHKEPKRWAAVANDRAALEEELRKLVDRGLFYLRYTTGEPALNMRDKGVRIVADYVQYFAEELECLTFEPEREFETLVPFDDGEGAALIAGAVDIVRLDDPPRVTLIDFKSGDPDSDRHRQLDEDEMRLQVGIYAVAAKRELEYEPDKGLVRYLDVNRDDDAAHELEVPLDPESVESARRRVVQTATAIRDRKFNEGPSKKGPEDEVRCKSCDFLGFCGMEVARKVKRENPGLS